MPLWASCHTFTAHNEPTEREGPGVCACKCENMHSEKEFERVSDFSYTIPWVYPDLLSQFTKLGIFCQIKAEDHVSKYSL